VTAYRVTAPYVTCRSASASAAAWGSAPGWADSWPVSRSDIAQFHEGAVLPDDVPQEDIDHLLAVGLIEPVEDA